MEMLILIFGALFVLCGPVGLVLGIIALRRLARLQRARAGSAPAAFDPASYGASSPAPTPHSSEAAPAAPVGATSPPPPPPPRRARRAGLTVGMAEKLRGASAGAADRSARGVDLETVLGGQWLTWIGVLALFFGTAFFLGVDLGESTMSGLPQLLIGLAVAGAFCTIGRVWSRSPNLRFLGLGLLGGGVALLYLVAFAAYGIHQLVPMAAVFPLLLGVAVAGAMLALDRDSLTVAALTLTGALLTPILLPEGEDPTYVLLPYLVAVNLGAVLMGRHRGWAGLPLAAFVGSAVLVAAWMDTHFTLEKRTFAWISVGASWLIYALSPRLRGARPEFWSVARGFVTAANGLLFGLFGYLSLAPDATRYQGLALVSLAVVYLLLSHYLAHARRDDPGAKMSFYTGIALAVLAVPVQFDLSWVTLAWTALAAILLVEGVYRDDRSHRVAGLVVLGLALVRSVFVDLPLSQADPGDFRFLLNGEFLTGFAVAGLLAWLAWSYRHRQLQLGELEKSLVTPMVLTSVCVLWWKSTVELLAWWNLREFQAATELEPQRLASITLFWSLYAGAVVAAGLLSRFRPLRQLGLVLLGIATLKLVLWDTFAGRDPALGIPPFQSLPFLAGLVLTLVLGAMAWSYREQARRLSPRERRLPTPLLLTALCVLIWHLSVEILYLFSYREHLGLVATDRQSLLTLSLVWTLYSGAIIAAGFLTRFKALRLLGITLLAITILKVFLVDLTVLEKGYRIAAFVGLGILVLAVSLLYQKRRPKEAEADAPRE